MPVNGKSGSNSLRDRISKAPQVATELITVPEWDGVTIEVRGITLGQRNRIRRDGLMAGTEPNELFYPLLFKSTCFDPETGDPVFPDTDESTALIDSLNPSVADRVAEVAMRVAGLTKAVETDLGNGSVESLGSTPPTPSLSS